MPSRPSRHAAGSSRDPDAVLAQLPMHVGEGLEQLAAPACILQPGIEGVRQGLGRGGILEQFRHHLATGQHVGQTGELAVEQHQSCDRARGRGPRTHRDAHVGLLERHGQRLFRPQAFERTVRREGAQ